MDGSAFDRFARIVAGTGSRRRVLGLLGALPLSGIVTALGDDATQAVRRHHRRKARHQHQVGDDKRNRKGKLAGDDKGKHRCKPEPNAILCAGQCGIVTNGCGDNLDCGPCPCTPTTCAAQGKNCGTVADGCGSTIDCGSCTPPNTCGGGDPGMANICGCAPSGSCPVGANCGTVSDGCGGVVTCRGTCPTGQACVNNVCGPCVPRTCAQLGATCGMVGDGCGGINDCGPCPSGQTCGRGGVPNRCG